MSDTMNNILNFFETNDYNGLALTKEFQFWYVVSVSTVPCAWDDYDYYIVL